MRPHGASLSHQRSAFSFAEACSTQLAARPYGQRVAHAVRQQDRSAAASAKGDTEKARPGLLERLQCLDSSKRLGGRFGYLLFFRLGGGEGESEAPGGAGGSFFLLTIPRGGSPRRRKGGGSEGLGGCLRGIWGGGGG